MAEVKENRRNRTPSISHNWMCLDKILQRYYGHPVVETSQQDTAQPVSPKGAPPNL